MVKKLIWAVDAFEERGGPQLHAAEIIRRFQQRWQTVVKPVHILSPAELNLSAEFVGPWLGYYLPSAENAMRRLVEELGLRDLEPPEVVTQSTASTWQAADTLSSYAQREGADLILVGTHGRKGLSRFLLGSFAESLLSRSEVPVMVVGQRTGPTAEFKELLFPTDFGDFDKEAFRRAAGLARDLGSRMMLYRAVLRPIEPVMASGVYMLGSPWLPAMDYSSRLLARTQRRLDCWADWAAHQGIQVDTLVDTEVHDISASILAAAKKRGVDWIALSATSGPIASALLGSVTRKVVRQAECPVWVLRPSKQWMRMHPAARAA